MLNNFQTEILDKCVDTAANWTPVADRLWMA